MRGISQDEAWAVEELSRRPFAENVFRHVLREAQPLPVGSRETQQIVTLRREAQKLAGQRSCMEGCQQECHRHIASQDTEAPSANFVHERLDIDEPWRDRFGGETEQQDQQDKQADQRDNIGQPAQAAGQRKHSDQRLKVVHSQQTGQNNAQTGAGRAESTFARHTPGDRGHDADQNQIDDATHCLPNPLFSRGARFQRATTTQKMRARRVYPTE